MSRIITEVAGEPVKLLVLPPATEKFARHFTEFMCSDEIFGLDVETTSIDQMQGMFNPDMRLRLVQFGNANTAWALDPFNEFWRLRILSLLSHESKRFVSHTNYDPLWVRREFGIDLGQRSIDTYPMAALLWPGERTPKDLKDLADRLIDKGLSKAEAALYARFKELAPTGQRVGDKLKTWGWTNIPLDDEIFGTYAGLDAVYVRRLLDILAAKLKKNKMAKLSFREQRISRMATDMQVRGMKLDLDWTNGLLREVEDEYLTADARLADTFGFSPRSPKRGLWLQKRGVHFTELTPTGQASLTKDTIPNLVARYKTNPELGPIFEDMNTLSKQQNLMNNLRTLLASADADGFVHPRINTQAAITGRMSIVRPAMQTFKKRDPRLRGCFIVRDDDSIFVGADYKNQETRIALAYSSDESLANVIFNDLNQHELTAELIFGKSWSKESTDGMPSDYDKAKILDFAQQYGAGPKKIGDQLGMPRGPRTQKNPDGEANPEAVALWKAWRKAYQGLVAWSAHVAKFSSVVNPWGREIPSDAFRRYANGNYAIQSSGRDMLGDAMVKLEDAGWAQFLWLPIHDELVLEVPKDKAEKAVKALEKYMYCKLGDIEIPVDSKIIGKRWSGKD